MNDISIIISIIGALIAVGTWLINRRESKSRIKESLAREENFETITDKLRGEIIEQLRAQLGEQNKALVIQNKELTVQNKQLITDLNRMEVEIKNLKIENREKDARFENETTRWRDGYRRLEERIRGAENDLRTEREEKSRLYRELIDTKRNNEQVTQGYVNEIEKLRGSVEVHNTQIRKLQTGQLPQREDLGKDIGE